MEAIHIDKIYAYIRVSTSSQNTDRQLVALNEYAKENNFIFDGIFEDKLSGKDFDRPKYQLLKEKARAGDTIIVKELDRLGRNYEDIKKELAYFCGIGVKVIILDLPLLNIEDKTLATLINNIILELLSYIAERERVRAVLRVREGLSRARAKGILPGRPPRELPKEFFKYYDRWKSGEFTATEFAKLIKRSRQTLYSYIDKHEGKKPKPKKAM